MNEEMKELFKFVDDAETLVNPCFIGVPKVMKSVTTSERIAKVLGVDVEHVEAVVDATIDYYSIDTSDRTNEYFLRGVFKSGECGQQDTTLISGAGLLKIGVYLSNYGEHLDDDGTLGDNLYGVRCAMQYMDALRYSDSEAHRLAYKLQKTLMVLDSLYTESKDTISTVRAVNSDLINKNAKLKRKNKRLKKELDDIYGSVQEAVKEAHEMRRSRPDLKFTDAT